jgi:Fe-S cluster biogenesis protein NfuA
MISQQVEIAMQQVKSDLIGRGSDVELLSTTELGVVLISLSGDCCNGRLKRLMTVLDIEAAIKKQVPGVKIVMEEGHAEAGLN